MGWFNRTEHMPATINRSFISLKEVFCGVYNNIYKKGLGLLWGKSERNKHNCVLLNAGLSNALTKTGFCTSLKCGFYFRFHLPSTTKSALPNFICTWELMLICWKMCSPEPKNCRNQNPHTSKIGKLLLVCVGNRRQCDDIPEPLAKFGENR